MKKDEVFQIEITDISEDGQGIGKVDGFTLFVKDTIVGDLANVKIMKLKKNYGFAKLLEVVRPSVDRAEPKCKFHKQCGGCQIQAMDYNAQLKFKYNKVLNNLTRIGRFERESVEEIMENTIGMENPYYYRNKAQFPFGKDKEGRTITGFYAERTHFVVENTDCALGIAENESILKKVLKYMELNNVEPYDEIKHLGLIRHVLIRKGFATGEIMVCLVINGKDIPNKDELIDSLLEIKGMKSISININKEKTNVIMGDKCRTIWGSDTITDYIGDTRFIISPLSFFQVNPVQTKKLYDKALEFAALTDNETVWDLYCGIGTISLFLAKKAKQVYGVEIVPQAIDDARTNARINNIDNAEFFVGKAEDIITEYYENNTDNMTSPDVIVVDPPRKGCDEVCLDTMVKMNPKRIVYVSCDSATLARDLRILCDNGYELKKVQPVDQFCHTVHVETVVLMSRKDK